jgi:hypothetical protein
MGIEVRDRAKAGRERKKPRNLSMTLIWSIEWMEGESPAGGGVKEEAGAAAQISARLTSVYAEYSIVDHDGQRKEVEHVREIGPDVVRAVLAHALGVEAVILRHD